MLHQTLDLAKVSLKYDNSRYPYLGTLMTEVSEKNETPSNSIRYTPLLICLIVALALWFSPKPEELSYEAWHLLAIFITTILGLVIKPMPMGGVALISITTVILTQTLSVQTTFSGFHSTTVWLVIFALFIARGFAVTGLGKRLAYFFSYRLGKSSLGLSYGLIATDLMIAPATPSVTGRIAGIVFPILKGLANSYKSYPNCPSSKKIGGFLTLVAFQGSVVTSSMFLTAMAANPILFDLTTKEGLELSWVKWALAAIVPGIINLIMIPIVIYFIYPPEIKRTPDAPQIAYEHLKQMGKISSKEWIMVATICLLLILWIFGGAIHEYAGIEMHNAVVAAMIGLVVLLITGVLNWKSLVKMDGAWETFVWFCVLIMLAGSLKDLGVVSWFSNTVGQQFNGVNWKIAFPVLALIYFYSHYFFASSTAHVYSMYTPFLLVSIGLGAPPMLAAFILIFFSNLFGGITHYSLAPAPLLYGEGYVDIKDWWRVGFIVSLLNILIWSTIGIGWWKLLGFW